MPQCTPEELEAAANAAAEAFHSWKKTTVLTRQRLMLDLQHVIRERMDELADSIVTELGKTDVGTWLPLGLNDPS